ncbi:protein nanos isoform X1 [Anastrepha ludens]|uniref:protein nanos isoform X1 n=1 Tax=Anastrepha ludens TaxID=28586 RepID=UPI0023B11BCC|nr:protein nanos isoform X1 [Anastrepha ludens]
MPEMYLDSTSTLSGSRSCSSKSSETMSPDIMNAYNGSAQFFSSTQIPTTSVSSITMIQPRAQAQVQCYGHFNGYNGALTQLPYHQQYGIHDENVNQGLQWNSYRMADATLAQKQPKNEISKSLKMFAMLAAYKYGKDPIKHARDSPMDDIMKDFYCNGYVADESNLHPQGHALMETSSLLQHEYVTNKIRRNNNDSENNLNYNTTNYGTNNGSNANPVINSNNEAFFNQCYFNPNLCMMKSLATSPFLSSGVTSHPPRQHAATVAAAAVTAAATAAASANIDYNSQNIKRPQKRYGSAKFDKFSAVKHCVFCENNNEPEAVVKSHAVRDSLGRVLCPKLRTYICPICKASGDKAHTVKYCPQKPIITMEDAVKAESLRLAKNFYYKQRMKV